MIRTPIDTVLDNYCIALLKLANTGDENYKKVIRDCVAEFDNYSVKDREFLDEAGTQLLNIHSQIWETEGAIRRAEEENLGLEEVGRRALKVRDLNRERQNVRALVIEYFGEGVKDVKCNYAGGSK